MSLPRTRPLSFRFEDSPALIEFHAQLITHKLQTIFSHPRWHCTDAIAFHANIEEMQEKSGWMLSICETPLTATPSPTYRSPSPAITLEKEEVPFDSESDAEARAEVPTPRTRAPSVRVADPADIVEWNATYLTQKML